MQVVGPSLEARLGGWGTCTWLGVRVSCAPALNNPCVGGWVVNVSREIRSVAGVFSQNIYNPRLGSVGVRSR